MQDWLKVNTTCLYNYFMIILSIGMPRAGSGWYYNLTNDLIVAGGGQDAHIIRPRFHLERVLTEVNCNIGALTFHRLLAVLIPSLIGNKFVIKVHAGPTSFALLLIKLGMILPTYIYRDPRDAMLSAIENGKHALERGQTNAFSPLVDFNKALDFSINQARIWEAWTQCEGVFVTRYEDLLGSYFIEAERLTDSLGLDFTNPKITAVIEKYRPGAAQPGQDGLHFSFGRIGRFRVEMSQTQQEAMSLTLGRYIEQMGYDV